MSQDFFDRDTKSVTEQAADVLRDSGRAVSDAFASLKQPHMPLDILARATRQNPLPALLAAFAIGIYLTRRRR
jgi:hypothetical protein